MPQLDFIHSVNLNAETEFPYLVLNVVDQQSYPRNAGFQVFHWHEDLQFIYVIDGLIELDTLEHHIKLQAGQGIFINKNVVHMVKQLTSCHYNSFVFPDYFLKFYPGSPAGSFTDRITSAESFPYYYFSGSNAWERDALNILKKMVALEYNKTICYSYEVLVLLTALWLLMQKNVSLPSQHPKSTKNIRMQKFLSYIEQHYAESISLEDLAYSAHVGKSECLRCFRNCLNISPYKYLLNYRLSKAVELLKTTDLPIGEISEKTGFHQMSYFGKCFREKTGFSPRAYRNEHRK